MPYVECKICEKSFYAKPRHLKIGWGKYCSKQCQYEGQQKGFFVSCKTCKEQIRKTPKDVKHSKSGNFFCNKKCQTIWRNKTYIESEHPTWKTGINAYRNILSRSKALKICVRCGINDVRILIVHHVDKNRHNNNLSNLVWLCPNCHMLIHRDDKEMQIFMKSLT